MSISLQTSKKNIIFMALLSLMFLSLSVIKVSAVVEGEFTIDRTYQTGYTVTLNGYSGNGGVVTLPTEATFSGTVYPITAIGTAFSGNTKITSIIVPSSYTSISVDAFKNCVNLESISLPGSLTTISANAFEGCSKLTSVTFEADTASTLSLLNDVFLNCTSLETLELPGRLSSTSNNFVRGCTNLTTLTVGTSDNYTAENSVLYKLGTDSATLVAYAHGKTDQTLTVPAVVSGKPVTTIGMHALRGNTHLTEITLPESVIDIKGYAFNGLTSLQKLIVNATSGITLASEAFTSLPVGSLICVQNQEIADSFEPLDGTYGTTYYYTEGNTTVQVGTAVTETVDVALSIDVSPTLSDGKVVYNIYTDSAAYVNTLLLKVHFDKSKVDAGSFAVVNPEFDISTANWTEDENYHIFTSLLGKTGNTEGYSTSQKVKLMTISVPIKSGVAGLISAELVKAASSGIIDIDESAIEGQATITPPSIASYIIENYDINGDGVINQVDITEAQRYYMSTSTDSNWAKAQASDVNADGTIDIEDFICIFNNISDF